MSDILKQAKYALKHWNLSTGHEVLLRSLVEELEKLEGWDAPGLKRLSEAEASSVSRQVEIAGLRTKIERLREQRDALRERITVVVGGIDVDLLNAISKQRGQIERQLARIVKLQDRVAELESEGTE